MKACSLSPLWYKGPKSTINKSNQTLIWVGGWLKVPLHSTLSATSTAIFVINGNGKKANWSLR